MEESNQAQIQTSDGMKIVVSLQDSLPALQQIYEFIGQVQGDRSLHVQKMTAYSDNFNMPIYNEFILLANNPKNAPLFWGN
jgi:hypothetical protein